MLFLNEKYTEIEEYKKKNSGKYTKTVAVSKNHSLEAVKEAINFGIRIFGENRVQEAKEKFKNLKSLYTDLELHLTGPLQTNKVKLALEIFDVFQTLDREKLALEFVKHIETSVNKKFFIQINTGLEKTKSGVYPSFADEFIQYCVNDLNLPIIGLMCIPPLDEKPKKHFLILKKIAEDNNLKHLSMGMSNDYKEAILCGATYVRIGTKIFGKRNEN